MTGGIWMKHILELVYAVTVIVVIVLLAQYIKGQEDVKKIAIQQTTQGSIVETEITK